MRPTTQRKRRLRALGAAVAAAGLLLAPSVGAATPTASALARTLLTKGRTAADAAVGTLVGAVVVGTVEAVAIGGALGGMVVVDTAVTGTVVVAGTTVEATVAAVRTVAVTSCT